MAPIRLGAGKCYIGAHRGASKQCPENTMAAFKKALDHQADFIELDVQLTKDSEVVVFHDLRLERTTNGKGMVKDHLLTELKQLDAGAWFSKAYAGVPIPTLEEVLAWAQNKVWLSIELKLSEPNSNVLAHKVVSLIKHYQMEDQVQVMSFHHQAVFEVRQLSKNILTSAICGCSLVNPVKYLNEIGAQILNTPWYFLSKAIVEEIHRHGLYVCGGLNDDLAIWERYQLWKVDMMDTNISKVMAERRRRC